MTLCSNEWERKVLPYVLRQMWQNRSNDPRNGKQMCSKDCLTTPPCRASGTPTRIDKILIRRVKSTDMFPRIFMISRNISRTPISLYIKHSGSELTKGGPSDSPKEGNFCNIVNTGQRCLPNIKSIFSNIQVEIWEINNNKPLNDLLRMKRNKNKRRKNIECEYNQNSKPRFHVRIGICIC